MLNFDDVDMDRQIQKQKAFLTMVFGGPNDYSGKDMREGHKHLVERGLNESHFDAVIENLAGTLKELGDFFLRLPVPFGQERTALGGEEICSRLGGDRFRHVQTCVRAYLDALTG